MKRFWLRALLLLIVIFALAFAWFVVSDPLLKHVSR
jgi:hypothetical protein